MHIMGQNIGSALCEALGLPAYTTEFTLRAAVGEFVTVNCTYYPGAVARMTDLFRSAVAEFRLVRVDEYGFSPHQAEAQGFDAWMRERNAAAHRDFMQRTAQLP